MLDNGLVLSPLSRAIVLVVALGLGGALAGCADIHPEGDDSDVGIMDAPDDEAVDERATFERETEHGDEQEGKR